MFIAGKSDRGICNKSDGDIRVMKEEALTRMDGGLHLRDSAGYWVQQEQLAAVTEMLVQFI